MAAKQESNGDSKQPAMYKLVLQDRHHRDPQVMGFFSTLDKAKTAIQTTVEELKFSKTKEQDGLCGQIFGDGSKLVYCLDADHEKYRPYTFEVRMFVLDVFETPNLLERLWKSSGYRGN